LATEPLICVRDLRKHFRVHRRRPGLLPAIRSVFHRSYDDVRAVDGVSFDIAPGERVGFLGPNGAGKTTTLKVLAGLLHPTAGAVRIAGYEPRRRERAFLERIMLVTGQKQQLLWDLPPSETFELNRAVYDVPRPEFERTVAELRAMLELDGLLDKPTRQLSLGERMKCELAAALIHRPTILFLDEPTIGLDVSMQSVIREFIRNYNEHSGATIILTSHYMDDVAALCPRVIVIDLGRLSYDGSLESLAHRVRPEKRVALHLVEPIRSSSLEGCGRVVHNEPLRVVLQVEQAELQRVVGRVLATLPVQDLTVENPPLEEVMSEFFARSRRERERAPADVP